MSGYRDRAKAAEGFPYHVAFVRGGAYGYLQEAEGLLVDVDDAASRLEAFVTVDGRFTPYVGDSILAVKISPAFRPTLRE